MLNFKALLFDLDGTLVDTAPDFITAVKKQLEIRGGQLLDGDIVRTSVTHGSIGIIESKLYREEKIIVFIFFFLFFQKHQSCLKQKSH
mgnify:CR=1 FL=1